MIFFFFFKVLFVQLDGAESRSKQFFVLSNSIQQQLILSSLPPPFSDPGVSVDSDESQREPLVYHSYSISDNPLPQWDSSSQFCAFSGKQYVIDLHGPLYWSHLIAHTVTMKTQT